MNAQELILLGEIKRGVEENGNRMDRHNAIHEKWESKITENSEGLVAIKATAAGIAFVISALVAAGSWFVSLWGAK